MLLIKIEVTNFSIHFIFKFKQYKNCQLWVLWENSTIKLFCLEKIILKMSVTEQGNDTNLILKLFGQIHFLLCGTFAP